MIHWDHMHKVFVLNPRCQKIKWTSRPTSKYSSRWRKSSYKCQNFLSIKDQILPKTLILWCNKEYSFDHLRLQELHAKHFTWNLPYYCEFREKKKNTKKKAPINLKTALPLTSTKKLDFSYPKKKEIGLPSTSTEAWKDGNSQVYAERAM